MEQVFDVAIIGGGINGCGIAADAALRGLSVILLEKEDLASKTSSASSKLIHGGLRYLEYYDFALVKKALDERQRLLNLAPHLVRPLLFVLPYQPEMRPAWFLRTGLFFYDNLSLKNKLPHSKLIHRSQQEQYFSPLKEDFHKGFLFYDCTTDDARLTIANAIQAKEHGASIQTRTRLLSAEVRDKIWYLTTQTQTGQALIKVRSVINATGPWVESTNEILGITNKYKMSLVKGSHIVVPKLYNGSHAYLLQNNDRRIVFMLPYQNNTMIGTTDVAFEGNLDEVHISSEEINYLCELVNNYLCIPIGRHQIINTWSGVRPLLDVEGEELKALSRDYNCAYSEEKAPAVVVYGGKITTYRQAALDAVNQLQQLFPHLQDSLTAQVSLPGSRLANWSYSDYLHQAREKYFWLEEVLRERYFSSYGTGTESLLAGCHQMADLGHDFGNSLYRREVDYLVRDEWARDCDDILWRRTKLGLNFPPEKQQALAAYLSSLANTA